MNINRLIMRIVVSSPLVLGLAIAHAQDAVKSTETTTTTVITTSVPAPKETVAAPEGYVACTKVAAGWEGKTWHPEHEVCRYDTTKASVEGEAWIAGHWECSQYTAAGSQTECTSWDWAKGHWVKTLSAVE